MKYSGLVNQANSMKLTLCSICLGALLGLLINQMVLLDLHRAQDTTTLLVSHHDADVRALSDRAICLEAGRTVSDQLVRERAIPALIRERVERIYVDDITGQWVIETATAQFCSTNADWKAVSTGDVVQLTWHSSSTRSR